MNFRLALASIVAFGTFGIRAAIWKIEDLPSLVGGVFVPSPRLHRRAETGVRCNAADSDQVPEEPSVVATGKCTSR